MVIFAGALPRGRNAQKRLNVMNCPERESRQGREKEKGVCEQEKYLAHAILDNANQSRLIDSHVRAKSDKSKGLKSQIFQNQQAKVFLFCSILFVGNFGMEMELAKLKEGLIQEIQS